MAQGSGSLSQVGQRIQWGYGGIHAAPTSLPWAEAQCRLTAPAWASRKDLVVAFQDTCSMIVPGHCVFVPGIYPQAFPDTGSSQHTPGTSMALPSCRDNEPTEQNRPSLHPLPSAPHGSDGPHSHPSSHNPKLSLHPPLPHPTLCCSEAPRANLSCRSQGRQSTDAEALRTMHCREGTACRAAPRLQLSHCTHCAQAAAHSLSPSH